MTMPIRLMCLYVVFFSLITCVASATGTERDDELRQEMWENADKNFKVTEVPKKWAEKSAVVIAQMNRFEYRKANTPNQLRFNEYSHYRIKLIDKNAVNKYSVMNYVT